MIRGLGLGLGIGVGLGIVQGLGKLAVTILFPPRLFVR